MLLLLLLQVFAIKLVTFAVDFVPLAVEFGAFAVEFITLAIELRRCHCNGIRCVCFRISCVCTRTHHGYNDSKKQTTCHEVNNFCHGRYYLRQKRATEASFTGCLASKLTFASTKILYKVIVLLLQLLLQHSQLC